MKELKNFKGYFINEIGEVYSSKTDSILKGGITDGYKFVNLKNNEGKYKSVKIHRLVAETFLKNDLNFPCVNHINGIKTDNCVNNLEWCTYSYNSMHSYKNGLQEKMFGEKNHMYKKRGKLNAKSKKVICKKNDFEKEFESVELAVDWLKENGFDKANSSSISQCCNGIRYKSAYGFVWKYILGGKNV